MQAVLMRTIRMVVTMLMLMLMLVLVLVEACVRVRMGHVFCACRVCPVRDAGDG